MKKLFTLFSAFGFWLLMGSTTLAMCIWFVPEGRIFEPASNVQTLIVSDEDERSLVVQPQWTGNATDFALLMPFANKPEISEAPEEIFTELEDLTNPVSFFNDAVLFGAESAAPLTLEREDGVTVLEQRDVGDYTATTLTATNVSDLQNWLNDNNYQITDDKESTLAFYIDNGSQFFVALKVNVDAVNLEDDGALRGELKPLQFDFRSSDVTLPLRLMAGAEARVDLVIYTLGDEQYFIPGAEIQFARKVTAGDLDEANSLETYDARSQWLTRNSIQFNPAAVESDATLLSAGENIIVENGLTKRVNPDQLDPKTGLIESNGGELVYTNDAQTQTPTETEESASSDNDLESPILIGAVVVLGIANIFLLNKVFGNSKSTKEKKS